MKRSIAVLISLAILAGSALVTWALFAARDDPDKKQRRSGSVAVETVKVHAAPRQLDVRASGVVVPARELLLHPEASGRIAWLHEELAPGTFVKEDQLLYRMRSRDYQLAVKRAKAELARAKSELALERGRQTIAREEWSLLQDGGTELEKSALALRKPQLESAQSVVAVAEANLADARLGLSRTTFRAPFAAVVVDSNAEIGQLATPSSQLARLVGTQHFWVRVAIAADKIPFIRIPGIDGEKGASVVVKQAVGSTEVTRTGRVIRLLSDREASSRMARVVVRIDDPYGFEQADESGTRPYPILLDTYVDVIIAGKQEKRLVEVPRSAVHEGNQAYVFEPQGSQLSIRKLSVAWTLPDTLLVEAGLKDGERVITSPLTSAVEGMKLREVPAPVSGPDAAPGGVPDG